MSSQDFTNQYPEETQQIYETISRRVFMKGWSDLHPIANEFQRKVVIDMADDIISVVLGVKQ